MAAVSVSTVNEGLTLFGQAQTEAYNACKALTNGNDILKEFNKDEVPKIEFGQEDKAEGSGYVAVIPMLDTCKSKIDEMLGLWVAYKPKIDALTGSGTDVGGNTVTAAQLVTMFADMEKQFTYATNAKILATVAGAAETNAAFTAGDNAAIGLCMYQEATSEYATCWSYQIDVEIATGNANLAFQGFQMSAAEWFAKPENGRKMDNNVLSDLEMGKDPVKNYYTKWGCLGLDALALPILEAGRKAAVCQKLVPGADQATAKDPAYTLGDMEMFVYNSSRQTAQAAARSLGQGANQKFTADKAFYSYNVNTGAISGLAMGVSTLAALALSQF